MTETKDSDRPQLGELLASVTAETAAVLDQLDLLDVEALFELLIASPRMFVLGEGRSGAVMRMAAIRFLHLGRAVHVVGETTTPPIGPGDLLLVCSGSGQTAVTSVLAEGAKQAGATIALITAAPESRLSRIASVTVRLPTPYKGVQDAAPSIQYGGTLFEQSALLLCDTLVLALMRVAGPAGQHASLVQRHANLE